MSTPVLAGRQVIKITLFVVGAISGAVVGYGLYIVVLSRFSTDTDIGGKERICPALSPLPRD